MVPITLDRCKFAQLLQTVTPFPARCFTLVAHGPGRWQGQWVEWLRKILSHIEKNKWVCKSFLSLKPLNSFHLLSSWTKGRSGNKVVPTGWNRFEDYLLILLPAQPLQCHLNWTDPEPLQDVPLWYPDCFQLKTIEAQKIPTQGIHIRSLGQRTITRDNFLSEWSVCMVWQTSHDPTSVLVIICESPSLPLKPQVPVSFFSSGWHLPNLSYRTPVRM